MPSLPAKPYFSCMNPPTGYFDLEVEEAMTTASVSRSVLLKDDDDQYVFYDSDGFVWNSRLERPALNRGFWSRVATNFYNPSQQVDVKWTRVRQYSFEELRAAYIQALERDDDILTQFAEREELKALVEKVTDFAGLVTFYNWSCLGEGFHNSESDEE